MPYALIAPLPSVPSRPRLMRPERSVMHSPRLTNRNGVETRMAPPNTARGTVQSPIVPSAMSGFPLQEANPPVNRVAREHEDEDDPQRILPRQEGNQNAGKPVAGGKVGVGAALYGGDLDHSGKAGRRARQKTDRHDQFADAEAHDPGGANIAAGDAGGEAEHGVINQYVGCDRSDNAERQSPMHVGAGYRSDHVGGADLPRRRLVEAGRVAHRPLDQMVEDRESDVDEQQAGDRLVDAAVLTKPARQRDPKPAADHAGSSHRELHDKRG